MQSLVSFRTIALGGSSIASILLGFVVFDVDGANAFVGRYGYWIVFTAFALLLVELFKMLYAELKGRGWLSNSRWREAFGNLSLKKLALLLVPAASVILMTFTTLKSQPWQFKIVMDEPVLMATAKQMHLNKQSYCAAAQYTVGGIKYNHSMFVDKRPLLYPFLVSILHDWTGYRIHQGIVLNAILLLVLNATIYLWGRALCPPLGGYISLILFNTIPLLAINATSSGFDVLNLLLIAGLPAMICLHLKRLEPGTLNGLLLYTVLLAQTRYESVLFVVPTAVAILYSWWQLKRIMITKTMILVPLLLVTYPLQRTIMNSSNAFWQLEDGVENPFGLQFLASNLGHAVDYLFVFDAAQPNSILLTTFWVMALCALVYCVLKRKAELPMSRVQLYAGLGVALIVIANFLLLMLYHWGQINDPAATRLILPFLLLMTFFAVIVMGMFKSQVRIQYAAVGACLLYFLFVTRPSMAGTDYLEFTIRNAQADYLVGEAVSKEDRDILIISDRHLASNLGEDSSISIGIALNRLPQIELHQRMRTFDEIQIVYLLPTKSANMEADEIINIAATRDLIEEVFELETVTMKKLNDAVYLRHAKLLSVNLRESEELLDFDMSTMRIRYTGKIEFIDSSLPQQFTDSLPK